MLGSQHFGQLLEGRQEERLLTRLNINAKDSVIGGRILPDRPVECRRISRDGTQPRHSTVVDRNEVIAVLSNATVGDRGIFESVFTQSPSLLNIVDHRKDLIRFGIAIVEEELRLGRLRVPIQRSDVGRRT